MTPQERENPDLLNGSRRIRIAKGSGTNIQEVNKLVKQFDDTKKMMKMMGNKEQMAKMMRSMPQQRRQFSKGTSFWFDQVCPKLFQRYFKVEWIYRMIAAQGRNDGLIETRARDKSDPEVSGPFF